MTPEEIADRIALDDLMTRYVDAIDTKNWDPLDTVFTQTPSWTTPHLVGQTPKHPVAIP